MPRYNEEFKAKVVEKMMPPNARAVADVHRETGISEPTLYAWRRQFQNRGEAVPADPGNPESWSGRDKLAVVIETAALNEQALSEYCRRKGLYPTPWLSNTMCLGLKGPGIEDAVTPMLDFLDRSHSNARELGRVGSDLHAPGLYFTSTLAASMAPHYAWAPIILIYIMLTRYALATVSG